MSRPTIYSIARACGVSASTVSRAFSRPDAVRSQVRQRILEEARRQQYQPHLTARRLVTGRNQMIGVVVPDITNPFFPPLIRAIQQAADERGIGVLLADSGETPAGESRLVGRLRPQVDGLVIASSRTATGRLRAAIDGIPAVFINRVLRDRRAVVVDDRPALTAAMAHLHELGHRRVGLLSGPAASWSSQQRDRICLQEASRQGIDLRRLGSFDASYEGGLSATPAVLGSRATATIAFDDAMACGLLAGLLRSGRRVPEDVSIIGCDDVLVAAMVTPALTTLSAPVDEIGARAVAAFDLDDPQSLNSSGGSVERIPSRLTIRQSTGRAPRPRRS